MTYIFIKLKDWNNVISCAGKVLEIDPTNIKALYRRSYSYISLNNYDKAEDDINSLEEIIPDSKELNELKEMMKINKRKDKEKEAQIFKKMFKKNYEGKFIL
jgi:peptidyl-prolyl isomerase D